MRELDLNFLGKFRFSGDQALAPVGPCPAEKNPPLPSAYRLEQTKSSRAGQTDQSPGYGNPRGSDRRPVLLRRRRPPRLSRSSFAPEPAATNFGWFVTASSLDLTEIWMNMPRIVLKGQESENAAPEDSGAPVPVIVKEQRQNEAQERARISALSKPLKKELSKIEKELDLANKRRALWISNLLTLILSRKSGRGCRSLKTPRRTLFQD